MRGASACKPSQAEQIYVLPPTDAMRRWQTAQFQGRNWLRGLAWETDRGGEEWRRYRNSQTDRSYGKVIAYRAAVAYISPPSVIHNWWPQLKYQHWLHNTCICGVLLSEAARRRGTEGVCSLLCRTSLSVTGVRWKTSLSVYVCMQTKYSWLHHECTNT